MPALPEPFVIDVPQETLDDLNRRPGCPAK